MSAPSALEFSHEIPKLLRLLRGESNDLDCLPTEWDWQPFARACDDHQVAAFVFCRLKGKPKTISPGLLEYLRQRFYEISAHNYRLAKSLVDVTSLLQNESIPVLAFKGPTLAMAIYGDLTLRQYQDLDLMIRKEDLVKAVNVMSGCGFRIQPTLSRPQVGPYLVRPQKRRDVAVAEEIPFRSPSGTYYVDLHWQLRGDYWGPFSPDIDKTWHRIERQELPLGRVFTFCREDLFLTLCFHGTTHRWLFLKWLLDIAELLRSAETLDWSRVEEMTRIRPGVGACASVAVLLARDLLDAPVPAEAVSILPQTCRIHALAAAIREEILLQGRSSGDNHATLLELETRPVVRMKYRATRIVRYPGGLFREVFVLVSPKDRDLISLPLKFQFLYHFIRPVRLVVKHSIRVVRALWRRQRRSTLYLDRARAIRVQGTTDARE